MSLDKSPTSRKAKTTFSEEETEKFIGTLNNDVGDAKDDA